jgi:hypothetical protein
VTARCAILGASGHGGVRAGHGNLCLAEWRSRYFYLPGTALMGFKLALYLPYMP